MDGFVLLEPLGEGSFGAVRLAIEKATKRKVALKLIDKSTIRDVAEVARVTREFAILTSLNHNNVIRLYDVFHDPKYLCISMEYAEGGTLTSVLKSHKKCKLSEKEAKKLFHQICSALVYCHGLYDQMQYRLGTGCSFMLWDWQDTGAYDSSKADIWSLGVILYQMVTGNLPFP
ncbi:MARK1, partial [Symbiodinium sp. KB8]